MTFTITRLKWQRRFARSGWALQAGTALLLVCALEAGTAEYASRKAAQLREINARATQHLADQSRKTTGLSLDGAVPPLPAYATHLDDVAALFKLAADQGVELGQIEYRTEASVGPYVLRSLDLRLDGNYSKLKALVAAMLRYLPHLYVREIQMERASAPASSVHFVVKLSLAYQKPDTTSAGVGR